jgi:arylsulfatase A-like enzyme
MAADGVVFHDAFAPAPWTLPSFTSSLTGVVPSLHGAYLGGPMRNMDTQAPQRLRSFVPSLASHLSRLGYATAVFFSNPFFSFGLAETFDRHAYHNLPAEDLAWLALEWIRRHADRPFFCFVLFNDPHEPTTPPARLTRPYLADLATQGIRPTTRQLRALARWGEGIERHFALGRATLPLSRQIQEALSIKLALYDASIAHVDRVVGSMQQQLEKWGLRSRTLTTLYSDHGEEFLDHLGEARSWNHDPREIRAIGHGHTQFQELLHVPWIASGPGVPTGIRWEAPVSLCDVAPTLADWLGVDPMPRPSHLLPSLLGHSQKEAVAQGPASLSAPDMGDDETSGSEGCPAPADDRLLVSEAMAFGPDLVAVRREGWKLIATRDGEALGLYHLAEDPHERRECRNEQPEVTDRLLTDLAAWRRAADAAGVAGSSDTGWTDVSRAVRHRLRELGYAE